MPRPPQHFRAFTTTAPGRANRILTKLQISAAFDPAHPPTPLPATHTVSALWDTGATGSMISSKAVLTLGLTPTGAVRIATAGGVRSANTHMVNLFLPNSLHVVGVPVAETDAMQGFDAIVGMDIITQGDFAITNVNGRTCMSFRFPSIRTVDFVHEANEIRLGGVRPNDPCPCGKTDSNGRPRKFKKCCRPGFLAARQAMQ